MKIGNRKLDLPQAIILAAMVVGAAVVVGLVLTWGPTDSRSLIAEWGAGIGGVLGSIYLALKGGLLTPHPDAPKVKADGDGGGPSGAVLVLFIAAASIVGTHATGCGGVPREARVAVEQASVGVDRADDLVTERIATRGVEARRQVLEETIAGLIASVEAGELRFDVLLAAEVTAEAALRAAHSALNALEAAFDAWEAGAGEGGFLGAAACTVVALTELATALAATGVALPAELEQGIEFLEALARGACPEPERPTAGGEATFRGPGNFQGGWQLSGLAVGGVS